MRVSDDDLKMYSTLLSGGKSSRQAQEMLAVYIGDDTARAVVREHERRAGRIRVLTDPASLTRPDVSPAWYMGPSSDDLCWPAYESLLLHEKKWPESAVSTIDQSTTKVLALMDHPGQGEFSTRGMVVGYVQSGKTANYTGLIAKATDVGYRLVIVLAGIHNSLRHQTQVRLQSELVSPNREHWIVLTDAYEDFRGNSNATAFLTKTRHSRVLLVVKKNAAVLRKLSNWLGSCDDEVLNDCPTIVIDDEADQAGLNAASRPDERTRINALMLEILGRLKKHAYVGYTATPFANVLVATSEPDDLYPRDFIVSLDKPEGYFGAESIFGRFGLTQDEDDFYDAGLDMVRTVPAEDESALKPANRNDRGTFEASVPESLAAALDYFALCCAARAARGHDAHVSMLIHTTLYTEPHESIARAVQSHWTALGAAVRSNDSKRLADLEATWNTECEKVDAQQFGRESERFSGLLPRMAGVLESAEIVVENGTSDTRLKYGDEPRVQIAIGGNSLSRGLTLEGLVVSYFVRTATAYDTLLQMGRWFGFRRGYEDLPRVWMTDELRVAFADLATVEEEIRRDIRRYDVEGLTPLQFPVRIRTHPTLAVTSPLKMRDIVDCNLDFSGQTRQTTIFRHRDSDWLAGNIAAIESLVADIRDRHVSSVRGAHHFRDVPVERIREFLLNYAIHGRHSDLADEHLGAYIEKQVNEADALQSWSVTIAHLTSPNDALGSRDVAGFEVNLVNRSRRDADSGTDYVNTGTITTQSDFAFDRSAENEKGPRAVDDPPLLVIVPISKNSIATRRGTKKQRSPLNAVEDIFGIAFDFPRAARHTPTRYVATNLPSYFEDEDELVEAEDANGKA